MVRAILQFLSVGDIRRVIPFIIPLAILLLVYIMPQDDLRTFLVFAVLILVFSIYRFDSRILIIYAILLLLIQGILTSMKVDDSVNRLAVLSYWLLVVGIACILINAYRKTKPVGAVA